MVRRSSAAPLAQGPVPLTPEPEQFALHRPRGGVSGQCSGQCRKPGAAALLQQQASGRGAAIVIRRAEAGHAAERRTNRNTPARGFRAAENAPSAGAIGGSNERTSERGWRRLGETPRTATPAGDRSTASEWRRFGSSRAAGTSPTGEPAASGRRSPDSGARSERGVDSEWRRFGSARTRVTSEAPGSEPGQCWTVRRTCGGLRIRIESDGTAVPRRGRMAALRVPIGECRSPHRSPNEMVRAVRPARRRPASAERIPRSEYRTAPDRGGRSFDGLRGGQSIRISPPIVRERSSPSAPAGAVRGGDYGGMRSGGGGGGRGGGGRSSGGGRGR